MFFVSKLSIYRAGRQLFDPISFELNPGEGLWLQGENGCGKSSLLSALAGLISCQEGSICWGEQSMKTNCYPYQHAMHYLPHELLLHPHLTIEENIHLDLRCSQVSDEAIDLGMKEWQLELPKTRLTGQLSAGQKQRVALLRLQLSQARLWLLDEPFVALDQVSQDTLHQACKKHLDNEGMLVITSHQPLHSLSERLFSYRLRSEVDE